MQDLIVYNKLSNRFFKFWLWTYKILRSVLSHHLLQRPNFFM